MNGIVFNHQDKARALIDALGNTAEEYNGQAKADFVLMDNDAHRLSKLRGLYRGGCRKFFVYPHDAGPNLTNDVRPVWEHTTACLVTAPGHTEIMGRYGYPRPIHEIGWNLCELKPFEATEGRKVLFAPIHPRCASVDQEENRKAFEILCALASDGKIELMVRYIDSLEGSGLSRRNYKNVKYVEGRLEPAIFQIDHADIVIGHLTFAYMAVARGVPTVFFGSDLPHHQVPPNSPPLYAKNWDSYKDLLAFPYDIGQTDDPLGMLQEAAGGDGAIVEWRTRMIGKQFDPDDFKTLIGQYIPEYAKSLAGMTGEQIRRNRLRYGKDVSTWPKD